MFFLFLLCMLPVTMYADVLSISQVANVKQPARMDGEGRGGIAYNGEFYLYISPDKLNATTYKSTNGVTWTRLNAYIRHEHGGSSFGNVTKLIWDGKQFVATCSDGIITSVDGVDWIMRTPDLWKDDRFKGSDIVFTGKGYAITGYLGPKMGGLYMPSPMFLYSEDLENYTIAKTTSFTQNGFDVERPFDYLLYANNKIIALGVQTIASSLDGKQWTGYTSRSSITSDFVEPSGHTIWDGEKYITVTDVGIYYSKDAKVWTPAFRIESPSAENIYLKCIAYNGTDYIASGESYSNSLIYYHSKDGKKWSKKVVHGTKANITTIYPTESGFLAGGSGLYKITTRHTGKLSSWSQSAVDEAISKKIYSYNVAPYYQGAAERIEIAKLITNAYEYVKQVEITYPNTLNFKDTQNTVVLKVAHLKLMNGLTATTFGPSDTITKEQLSVILTNLINQLNIKLTTSKSLTINDLSKVGAWAKPSVELMVNSGVMSLDKNKNFDPKAEVSLEQAIVLIMKLVNKA